jgi:lycopene beta-cyclase
MLYDSMMLDIFRLPGFRVSAIFMTLFANNDIENVLKFLVNETNFVQELRIMASVPPLPFLISIKNLLLRKLFHTNL